MQDVTKINIAPREGFEYRPDEIVIDAAEEARLLGHCGIDPASYHGNIDPASFVSLSIQAGVRNGISSNGAVNMATSVIQHQPLKLGEKVIVTGKITNASQAPRGLVSTSETFFARASGELATTVKRLSLRPNPAAPDVRGAGDRPSPVIEDVSGLVVLGEVQLTPENVKGYQAKSSNLIHVDTDAARKAGYRAPIIGGGMGVRYLTAAIWRRFNPVSIDFDIYFRRPLFWDDRFSICAQERGDRWTAVCLAKDGKVATEVRINDLARG